MDVRQAGHGPAATIGAVGALLGMVLLLLAGMLAPAAYANGEVAPAPTVTGPTSPGGTGDTCAGTKDDSSPFLVSGAWGSLAGVSSTSTATALVKAGWSVDLCVKGGPSYNLYTVTCPAGGLDCAAATLSTPNGEGVSHIAWVDARFTPPPNEPDVSLSGACDEATVTIVDLGDLEGVQVFIDGEPAGDPITTTTSYELAPDQVLTTSATGEQSVTGEDCTPKDPVVSLSGECDEATVTIVDLGDLEGVQVFIDGEPAGDPITTTTSYELAPDQVLTTSATGEQSVTGEDCTTPLPTPTIASFTLGTSCADFVPVLSYSVDVEQGDDPVSSIVLTVADASGVLTTIEVTGDTTGDVALPDRDGETVTVTWDFDDTSREIALADDCEQVLELVETPDPAPDPDPAPEVESERLPNAGSESALLALLGGGLLAIGCLLLLLDDRRLVRLQV